MVRAEGDEEENVVEDDGGLNNELRAFSPFPLITPVIILFSLLTSLPLL